MVYGYIRVSTDKRSACDERDDSGGNERKSNGETLRTSQKHYQAFYCTARFALKLALQYTERDEI